MKRGEFKYWKNHWREWKFWRILCYFNKHIECFGSYRTVIDSYGDKDGQKIWICFHCEKILKEEKKVQAGGYPEYNETIIDYKSDYAYGKND